jgi:hypothetical protein
MKTSGKLTPRTTPLNAARIDLARLDGAASQFSCEEPRGEGERDVHDRRNDLLRIARASHAYARDLRPNVKQREEREGCDA